MKVTRRLYCLCVAALLLAGLTAPLGAHDLPREVLIYVKAEGSGLRVLVRVPIAFLADARLPVANDGYLDLRALAGDFGPLNAIASDVVRNLDLMDDERPLPAPQTLWTISTRPDPSFDTYDGAVAHLAAPRVPELTRIDPGAVLVDLQLDYPIASAAGRFSVRVNGFRTADRVARTQVRYVTADGETRTFIATGEPRRVALEPRWQSASAIFARLGIEQLSLAAFRLLVVLSLAIPQRSMQKALAAFGAFAAGWLVALIVSAFLPGPPDPSRVVLYHALAAAALVVVALQNIIAPRFVWVLIAAAGFGLLDGLELGFAYRSNAVLAGSHAIVSLVSFAVPILLGLLWLLLVAHPVVGLIHRLAPGPGPCLHLPGLREPDPIGPGVRGRWAIVLLSAIVIHAGLHGLLVGQ